MRGSLALEWTWAVDLSIMAEDHACEPEVKWYSSDYETDGAAAKADDSVT